MPNSRVVPAPESGIYRVAKGLDPFRFLPPRSPLPEQDEPVLDGNRWDDSLGEFAALYCASSAVAAFAETIARYREVPGLLDRIDAFLSGEPDSDYDFDLEPARVPRRLLRRSLPRARGDRSSSAFRRRRPSRHPRVARRTAATTPAPTSPARDRPRRRLLARPPADSPDRAPLLDARADTGPPRLGRPAIREPPSCRVGVLGGVGTQPDSAPQLARPCGYKGQC